MARNMVHHRLASALGEGLSNMTRTTLRDLGATSVRQFCGRKGKDEFRFVVAQLGERGPVVLATTNSARGLRLLDDAAVDRMTGEFSGQVPGRDYRVGVYAQMFDGMRAEVGMRTLFEVSQTADVDLDMAAFHPVWSTTVLLGHKETDSEGHDHVMRALARS